MLKKYGVEHAAQFSDFVVSETYFIKKYGEEIGKKMWNELCYNKGKSMRLEYYIEKYGEDDGPVKYSERIYNLQLHYDKKSSKISSLNKKFKNLLDSLNIDYEEEYCLWLDEITPRFYDFKIGKIIIELNGDFWHANPNKYKADDILNHPGSNGIKAKDIWKYDQVKKELAEQNGFKVFYIWETQINNNFEKIKEIFIKYANSKNKIDKENSNN